MSESVVTKNEKEMLSKWLKGDPLAVDLCLSVIFITHVWDDLIDGDPVTPEQINKAFTFAFSLPRNSFYLRNISALQPEIDRAITNWLDANLLEKEKKLEASYVLRCSSDAFFIKCAEIIGGWDWAREASIDIRRHIYNDFEEYKKEHS